MKKAFTLAEVLITLMIIGIVAALTIPSVISNYQQQEFKTGLKKAVSVLNEAIQTNIAMEGETPYETDGLREYLQRHMSILGTEIGVTGNHAFYTTDGMRFEFDGKLSNNITLHETGIGFNDILRTIISDGNGPPAGTVYTMPSYISRRCGAYGLANNLNETVNPPCIIIADVNGDRKPNPQNSTCTKFFGNGTADYDYSCYKNITPTPADKKLSDVFTIMITDQKAIPFGVVAQRAMYSK